VAFDGDVVGQLAQFLGQRHQQLASVTVQFGTAAVEEGSGSRFQEFDAQALGGDGHLDVVFEFLEVVHLTDFLLELVLQLGHVVLGEREVFARHA
jgi:hypothetical protein